MTTAMRRYWLTNGNTDNSRKRRTMTTSKTDARKFIALPDGNHVEKIECVFATDYADLERELQELKSHTWCAYCGAEFRLENPNTVDLIGAHIGRCEKHPMRRIEAQRDHLKQLMSNAVKTLSDLATLSNQHQARLLMTIAERFKEELTPSELKHEPTTHLP